MGTCGGKQDVISQSSIVTIETASEDVRKMKTSRKTQEQISLPTATMIETRSKANSEKCQERKNSETKYQNCSSEIQALDDKIEDQGYEIGSENTESVKGDNLNDKRNITEHGSQTDLEFEPLNEFEFQHEAGEFDAGYQRIINTNVIGESDGEWLEVINEVDELELDHGEDISLVESEIIEHCTNIVNNGNSDTSNSNNDKSSVVSMTESTNKDRKKSTSKGNSKLKRSDSSGSGKSVKNEKKKTDKDKVNKTKQDKLWTSRSQNKSNWRDEKIYTTKGKDGVLFKIKIMKRATSLEDKLKKEEPKIVSKKGKVTEKIKTDSSTQDQAVLLKKKRTSTLKFLRNDIDWVCDELKMTNTDPKEKKRKVELVPEQTQNSNTKTRRFGSKLPSKTVDNVAELKMGRFIQSSDTEDSECIAETGETDKVELVPNQTQNKTRRFGLKFPSETVDNVAEKKMGGFIQSSDTEDSECIAETGETDKVELVHDQTQNKTGCFGSKLPSETGVERIQLGKLLLLQDKNLISKFQSKGLEDIQFEDIVTQIDEARSTIENTTSTPANESLEEDCFGDDARETVDLDEVSCDIGEVGTSVKKRVKRVRWTDDEVDEIKRYAAKFLDQGKTPSRQQCASFVKQSIIAKGVLHRRSLDLIMKKISAMNIKARK